MADGGEGKTAQQREGAGTRTGAGDGDSPGAWGSHNGNGRGEAAGGLPRKTYYEWEEKSLKAMAQVLENRSPGRPPRLWTRRRRPFGSESKKSKRTHLAEKTIEVKELLGAYEEFRHRSTKKNRLIDKKR